MPGVRYVAAFLDRHLRGLPRPVLDGPTEQNPEALFWHHGRPARPVVVARRERGPCDDQRR
ncbi:hypothetical protein [Saccharopolyspora gregorii]|uniref:hypothetical protein n=1 Tax=Saccharopolyspora gregorii TaxID=33914 RepID=UPI0021AD219E|nr:hypothetical protein [Saccharopolyspora gregorii]